MKIKFFAAQRLESTLALMAIFVVAVMAWAGLYDDLAGFIASLVAVFSGAYIAFRLNQSKEVRIENERREESLNYSIFNLYRMINAVQRMAIYVGQYQDEESLAFSFRRNHHMDFDDLAFDYEKIAFLMKSSDPEILVDISDNHKKFRYFLVAIKCRKDFYEKHVDPIVFETFQDEERISVDDLKQALNPRVFRTCITLSQDIKDITEETLESLESMHGSLTDLLNRDFADLQVSNFVRIDPEQND